MNGIEGLALANKDYVAEQYRRWQADPHSVDESWALFFAGFELAAKGGNGAAPAAIAAAGAGPAAAVEKDGGALEGVYDLVHSYRELGHLVAHLNPLAPKPEGHPLLEPSEFGFAEADLDRVVDPGSFRGCGRRPAARADRVPAGDVLPHHRRRVPAHPRPRAARLAAGADGADAQPARSSRTRIGCDCSTSSSRPRASSSSSRSAIRRRSASRSRAATPSSRSCTRSSRPAAISASRRS